MKIDIFFLNSEIDSCTANVIKRAPTRKDDGGRKGVTPSIVIENTNDDGNQSYGESNRNKTNC